jgi:hypothetical protein
MTTRFVRPKPGAADRHAARVQAPDRLGDDGAAEHGRDAQLVPAGEEDAGRGLERREPVGPIGVLADLVRERGRVFRAELAEDALVLPAGRLQLARGRDDGDARFGPAAERQELPQDLGATFLVLGTTDRDDPTTLLVRLHSCRHSLLSQTPEHRR